MNEVYIYTVHSELKEILHEYLPQNHRLIPPELEFTSVGFQLFLPIGYNTTVHNEVVTGSRFDSKTWVKKYEESDNCTDQKQTDRLFVLSKI